MLYAKVVVGLPVEGPFDYIVPPALEKAVLVGSRVWVSFRNKRIVGYVTGLTHRTKISKLKQIAGLIDQSPVISGNILKLAAMVANYYCCSLGEALEASLPDDLRKGHKLQPGDSSTKTCCGSSGKVETVLSENRRVLLVAGARRMEFYLQEVKQVLGRGSSAILLFGDIAAAEKAGQFISGELGIEVIVSYRKQPQELCVWQRIAGLEHCVVAGTRSAIFSPVNRLGLIIVDREEDTVYKQEQAPHYHARQLAFMRSELEHAGLILASAGPSLESYFLAQNKELEIKSLGRDKAYPKVQIIDTRRVAYAQKNRPLISKFLSDCIYNCLNEKGKTLLFLNRRGFATYAACHNCGKPLKCSRCNISLVYHFEEGFLKCHHCAFKMKPPEICPQCNSGYIRYSGLGTEKIESELSRIFPQARIKNVEGVKEFGLEEADMFISTSSVIRHEEHNFDLVAVASIDNSLNRPDPLAAEKVYSLLCWLALLTDKQILIQSANPRHHCFRALASNDPDIFYREELKSRKELSFPPLRHLILVKLRGANIDKVKKAAEDLFEGLKNKKSSTIRVVSLSPGQPPKLRGNFYYQILTSAASAEKAARFLKSRLKQARYSGIIVTVDVDPA